MCIFRANRLLSFFWYFLNFSLNLAAARKMRFSSQLVTTIGGFPNIESCSPLWIDFGYSYIIMVDFRIVFFWVQFSCALIAFPTCRARYSLESVISGPIFRRVVEGGTGWSWCWRGLSIHSARGPPARFTLSIAAKRSRKPQDIIDNQESSRTPQDKMWRATSSKCMQKYWDDCSDGMAVA